jgi:hypothetical protein
VSARRFARIVAALLVTFWIAVPARAARPLLDRHQWDAYFALFARDANVPWKGTTVRLDTYSGAPVDFAAYEVDPADVIVAGQNRAPRALDTSHRTPVVRWRFSPPRGYRFETNDVAVPLGAREGFYVIEARRGEAVQQVWLNRTHIGIVTKESPEGLVVWGVDLRGGRAIGGLKVSFLVGSQLIVKRTSAQGTIVWTDRSRPTFALAESGTARAFVSLLPQAPLPAAIVGVRVESAVVRAGERIRFIGFARKRVAASYRSAGGDARVTLAGKGATLASTDAHLDAAGAFSGELVVPAALDAGDYAVLAGAAGSVGGTSVHVDAVSDVALALQAPCPCDPDRDVPLTVVAMRGAIPVPDLAVTVQIVRTPHVVPPGGSDEAQRWGTTVVYDRTLRTGADGRARALVPAPSDGLDSTYGVRATARGASATSRVVVPNAKRSLALEPAAVRADVGEPVAFGVRAFDPADGSPAQLDVRVRLSHGAAAQEQTVTLDAQGRGRVVFKQTSLGSNLALADALVDGRHAADAAAVLVEPSALAGQTVSPQSVVSVVTDRRRYRKGERVAVRASASGAAGDALVTLEGARTYQIRVVRVVGGNAVATLDLGEAQGAVAVTATFVRDGAIASGTAALAVDAPGHPRATDIALDKPAYAKGETLHVAIADGASSSGATLAVRIADGRESGSALFDDAPDVLAAGATAMQIPASADPAWHAYVAPARSKASDIFAAERPRKASTDVPVLGAAAPRTLFWRVTRAEGATLEVPVPEEAGRFVLSVLKISDDGDVGAASASFTVR